MDDCSLNPDRKTQFHFSLHYNNCFGQLFEFSETNQLFSPLLAVKSSDSTDSPNQGHNNYGSQHSKNTLTWSLFTWNGLVFPWCVFTKLWKCREICFCEPGNWGQIQKEEFSDCECWIVAAWNQPEKHSGSFSSSLQQQTWSSFWVIWKQQAACHFFWEVI